MAAAMSAVPAVLNQPIMCVTAPSAPHIHRIRCLAAPSIQCSDALKLPEAHVQPPAWLLPSTDCVLSARCTHHFLLTADSPGALKGWMR